MWSASPTIRPPWSMRLAGAPRTAARRAWSPRSWSVSRATATTATLSGSTSPARWSGISHAPTRRGITSSSRRCGSRAWRRPAGRGSPAAGIRGPYDQGSIGLVLDIDPRRQPCGQEVRLLLPAHHRVSVTGEEHCQDTLRALLGRRREVTTVGKIRFIDGHPHRPGSGPVVEVEFGGSSLWLTTR